MSSTGPPEAVLRSVLWKLSAFLPDLVVLGGWVPYLHRMYGSGTEWRSEPVFTEELDLLLDPPLRRRAGRTIAEALRETGFRPVGGGAAPAVWESSIDPGERIEFFVDHGGPASTRALVRPVAGGGLGALSLAGLRLLRDHSVRLRVPVGRHEGSVREVDVTVPMLGAFVLHKAASFPRRPEGVKQAKDLFYLFEIMAAGEDVQADVEHEIAEIVGTKGSAAQELTAARYNLASVLGEDGALRGLFESTGEMVAERYRVAQTAARGRLEGHLRDLLEILASTASER